MLKGVIDPSMIASTSAWVQGLAGEFGLAHEDLYRIDLCSTELVTNVVTYAEARFAGTPLELHAEVGERRMALAVVDSAQAFDPRSVGPPPSQDDRGLQVGGQGSPRARVHRRLRVRSPRGTNRVRLLLNLAAPARAPRREMRVPRNPERRAGAGQPAFPLRRRDGATIESDGRSRHDRRAKGYLSSVQMFRVVPYSALEDLVDRFPIERIAATTTLLKRGDLNKEVLVVLNGRLKVYLDQPGTGDFIEIGTGGCVGEMSVIDNQQVSAHVVADAGTELLVRPDHYYPRLHQILVYPGPFIVDRQKTNGIGLVHDESRVLTGESWARPGAVTACRGRTYPAKPRARRRRAGDGAPGWRPTPARTRKGAPGDRPG